MKRWIKRTLAGLTVSGLALASFAVVSAIAAEWNEAGRESSALEQTAQLHTLPDQSAQEDTLYFTDVPQDAYYAPAVRWAARQGIVSGGGQGTFEPNALCTTAQAITMLWRGVGSPQPTGENPFSDVAEEAYYRPAAVWAYETGLISGTVFDGDSPCTRGDIILYLWRLMGSPVVEGQEETPWNLMLVNPWNTVPEDFSVSLASVGEGDYQVDERCVEALNQMLEDCRAAGLSPAVCSAYRTQQTQERLYKQEVKDLMALGWARTKAEQTAARSTAVPGTSEHQLGLAVDLVDNHYWKLDDKQATMPAQKWLMEHSWEYGFILRYPDEKSDITGIIYEPWHYRYVGREATQTIYEQGLCLEEYLQQREEYQSAVAWAMARGVTASASVEDFAPYDVCTRAQLVTFLYLELAIGPN